MQKNGVPHATKDSFPNTVKDLTRQFPQWNDAIRATGVHPWCLIFAGHYDLMRQALNEDENQEFDTFNYVKHHTYSIFVRRNN